MTNLVPPLNQPMVDTGVNIPSLNGSIPSPTGDLNGLMVGQQITVQINPQSLSQLGTNILLNMDISVPDIGGGDKNIQASVELPQQLKLPVHPVEMQIRIIAHTPQKIDFKIINIDGQPASSFIPKLTESDATPLNPPLSTSASVSSNIQQHPLLPLRAQPLLEQIFQTVQISSTQLAELVQSLPNYQIKMEISQLQSQILQPEQSQYFSQPDNIAINTNINASQTLLATSQQSVGANITPLLPNDIVDTVVSLVKNALQAQSSNMVYKVSSQPNIQSPLEQLATTTSSVQPIANSLNLGAEQTNINEVQNQLLPRLEQTLKMLVGQELLATVIDKGNIKILQTPLGEVVPELPLKLEAGEKLLLKISELIVPQTFSKDNHSLPPLSNKIIEFLKPLQEQIPADIFIALVAKIPAHDNKMLSNIISFLKAAETENITEWLGKELTDAIRSSGTKGQEILNQLEILIAGRKEENSQWRIIEVPFFDADNLSKIRVAIRKYHRNDENNHSQITKPDVARFVVDTTFSTLGAFQFDGFSIAKDKRFDLIIRTEKNIADDLCSQIMQLFRNSLSAVGYGGNIRIHIKEKFIKLCEDEQESTFIQDGLYI